MFAIRVLSIFILVQICLSENVFNDILQGIGILSDNTNRLNDFLSNLWVQSLLATLLVSAAPVLMIFIIPDLKNHHNLLKVLLAFAAGGLLGDAFLHLIPHSIDPHDHNTESHGGDHGHSHDHHHGHSHGHSHDHHHGHSHDNHHGHSHDHHHGHSHDHLHVPSHDHSKNIIVGLWVVVGIMSFLCVEKFVRLIKGDHSHSHSSSKKSSPLIDNTPMLARGDTDNPDTEVRLRRKTSAKSNGQKKTIESTSGHDTIKVSGYLNLVADFAHNFTDGLAIGASFLVNKNVGIVTTVTILFHELPHEIGDYAILIQSGCSRRKAMLLQLVTAIGALLGTVVSLVSQDAGTSSTWILPFTAGGFIYISTVSVIPELLEERCTLGQTIKEILAMIVGVGMMIAIAYFE